MYHTRKAEICKSQSVRGCRTICIQASARKAAKYIYSHSNMSTNEEGTYGVTSFEVSSEHMKRKSDDGIGSNPRIESRQKVSRNLIYNHKKPKWWKNICGKPSKAQKRSTKFVLETRRLPPVPYGSFINWNEIFPSGHDVWFEIGFGRGENLLALAHRKRDEKICLIGAEIHKPGVGTACQRVQGGMEKKRYWTNYVTYNLERDPNVDVAKETPIPADEKLDKSEYETPYDNLRIHPGDGMKLLPKIPSSSIAVLLVTFPDPFPGEGQAEWRLIQTETVLEIHRILRKSPSGLFFLATDHDGYNEWSHSVIDEVNSKKCYFEKLEPCPERLDWLPAISTYEQKGWDEGRQTRLNCWRAIAVEDVV